MGDGRSKGNIFGGEEGILNNKVHQVQFEVKSANIAQSLYRSSCVV